MFLIDIRPEYYATQEMCDKAINTCFFVFTSVPDQCKTQEIGNRVISEDPFMLIYCLNRYKTQKMFDEALMIVWQYQNLFLIGLLQVKCLKRFYIIFLQITIYFFFMEILVKSHLLMEWVLLIRS